jgi:predicted transcriptional regulator YheO
MTAQNAIKPYLPVIEAVVALFAPFLEVAIHDVKGSKIIAIHNNLSNRKVGDPSPLAELQIPVEKFPDVFDPYYETNWNGHKIKCTTVTIRDEKKNPIGLICFNLDTSVFQDIQLNLKTFLEVKSTADNPVELFNEGWQEKIDNFIASYLAENKLIAGSLTRDQKQKLVDDLAKHGIFFYKNAAQHVARKLHLSRATIYNYLKVLRATN